MLGKHSGRAALRERIKELGFELSDAELARVFDDFKALADKKKELFDGDIEALVLKAEIGDDGGPWHLENLHVVSDSTRFATGRVVLRHVDGRIVTQESAGDGPVDAALKAIEQATGVFVKLRKFEVRSVSSGEDAQGEAVVTCEYNGRSYRGTSVTTDIVESGVRAFLEVINAHRVLAPPRRRPERDVARRGRLKRTTGAGMTAQTLFEKVWERHVVVPETADTPAILYIDLHLTHEVTSPQAFDVLRARGLKVRRLDRTLATMDHSTPTDTAQIFGGLPIKLESAARQVRQLEVNCAEFGVNLIGLQDSRRGIVHIIGPGTGRHAARQDHRLRRQPHQHARRIRRPRLRHRHHRGRLRAGHAVPAAAQAEDARDRRRRPAAGRRDGQGPRARHHRQDRRQRRHRPRHRIPRLRHRRRCRWTSA